MNPTPARPWPPQCSLTSDPFARWQEHPEYGLLALYGHDGDEHLHSSPCRVSSSKFARLRFEVATGQWAFAPELLSLRVIDADRVDLPAAEFQRLQSEFARRGHALGVVRHQLNRITALERGRSAEGRSMGPAGGLMWADVGPRAIELARNMLPHWCLRIPATGDVYAAPSKEEAEAAAEAYCAAVRPLLEREWADATPEQRAHMDRPEDRLPAVAPWPYSFDAHAKDVLRWRMEAWMPREREKAAA